MNALAATWPAAARPVPRWIERVARAGCSRQPALQQQADSIAEGASEAGSAGADARDVAAALGGDGGAFARIVDRHQHAIARHLHRFTRDRALHEELVQDVFVEAWQSLAGYRGRAPLLHWLRRIATRVGYRSWTARARRRGEAGSMDAERLAALVAAPDALQPREAAELVHALLARLPPRDRLVLTLMYLDGCSVQEAASLTGWSRTMVKVQAHRARRRLAALLPPEAAR